jgi:Na+-transporting NADH:ubiquinone oxidoreductase subunit NqrC
MNLKQNKMKISTSFATTLVITLSLFCTVTFAQSVGIAADKQKQEALNKQRAHQAELQKKYNALPPEQQAEAKRRANEYKRGGYKNKSGHAAKTQSTTKPQLKPVAEPTIKTVVNPPKQTPTATKPAQGKPTGTSKQSKTKPTTVLMDANGKPLTKSSATTKPANTTPQKTTAPKSTSAEIKPLKAEPVKK